MAFWLTLCALTVLGGFDTSVGQPAPAPSQDPSNGGAATKSLAELELEAAKRIEKDAILQAKKALKVVENENAALLSDVENGTRYKEIRTRLEARVPGLVESKKQALREELNATRVKLAAKEKEDEEADAKATEEDKRFEQQEDGDDKKAKKRAKKEAKKMEKRMKKEKKEREDAIDKLKDDADMYEKQLEDVSSADVLSGLIKEDIEGALAKVQGHIDAVKRAAQGLSVASAGVIDAAKADKATPDEVAADKAEIEGRSDLMVYKAVSLGALSKELVKHTYKLLTDKLAQEEETRQIEAKIKALQQKKEETESAQDTSREDIIKEADATVARVKDAEHRVSAAKVAFDAATERAADSITSLHGAIGELRKTNVTSIANEIAEHVKQQVQDAQAAAEKQLSEAKDKLSQFAKGGVSGSPDELSKLAAAADAASKEVARRFSEAYLADARTEAANNFGGDRLRAEVQQAADAAKKNLEACGKAADAFVQAQKDVGIRSSIYEASAASAKSARVAMWTKLADEADAADNAIKAIKASVRAHLGVAEAANGDGVQNEELVSGLKGQRVGLAYEVVSVGAVASFAILFALNKSRKKFELHQEPLLG
eukprot:TRINITY_DN20278_c0_g2_i1.p1 TRINITY_DN20278_c0_g2~~TRINITY_DN20278_c0_g2_i1.p1  ORF type:complete len:602 (-),score=179.31 TRINITY_DN20278_c0_g2_i1:206-2011(-)